MQWFAAGKAIVGADERRFVPTLAQRRQRLSVRVTASSRGFAPAVVRTAATPRVARGTLRTEVAPTITGTPRVDEVLDLRAGSVSPSAASRSFRWYADGERIGPLPLEVSCVPGAVRLLL